MCVFEEAPIIKKKEGQDEEEEENVNGKQAFERETQDDDE